MDEDMDECSKCAKEIRTRQQKLVCCNCSLMYHRICIKEMTQPVYWEKCRDGTLADFRCDKCKNSRSPPIGPLQPVLPNPPVSLRVLPSPPVSLLELPSPPVGPLQAQFNKDQQVINLCWKHASDHGHSTSYIVEKQSPGDTDWSLVLDCKMRNPVVKDVTENTEYLFRVRTVSGNQQSLYLYSARPLCVGAFQSKPPSPPKGPITFSQLGQDCVTLSWVKSPDDGHMVVKYKIVQVDMTVNESLVMYQTPEPVLSRDMSNLQPGHRYRYTISCCNSVGLSTSIASEVTITGRPAPPIGPITASYIGTTCVTLSWNKSPDHDSPQMSYIITQTGVQSKESIKHINTTLTTTTIENLKPDRVYRFKIESQNSVGTSEESIVSGTVKTDREICTPAPPVGPITVSYIGTTCLTLSWNKSPDHGSPQMSYIITQTDVQSQESIKHINTTLTTQKIVSLKPDKEYRFKINSQNSVGTSKGSIVSKVVKTDREICKPAPPVGPITVSNIGTTCVTLSWNKSPDHGSQQISYIVTQHDVQAQESIKFMNTMFTTRKIDNLKPDHEYRFKIESLGFGTSEESIVSEIVKTDREICKPAPPVGPITVSDIETTCVTLSWGKSPDHDSEQMSYIITQSDVEGQETIKYINTKLTTRTIVNLKPEHDYSFKIESQNSCGTSGESIVSEVVKTDRDFAHDDRVYSCCRWHGNTKQKDVVIPKIGSVTMTTLPFYETKYELAKCLPLLTTHSGAFQYREYQFVLSSEQAAMIKASKTTSETAGIQVLLRFCVNDPKTVQADNYNPGFTLRVNHQYITTRENVVDVDRKKKVLYKPYDITKQCKSYSGTNTVFVQWPKCNPLGHCMSIDIAKPLSAEDLFEKLMAERLQHPEHTRQMVRKKLGTESDDDIATTSLQASLLCPAGKSRLVSPCRGAHCTHLQCVDALTVLKMNENKPKWICVICEQPASYDELQIDGLFLDILANVQADEVEFSPDGTWKEKRSKENMIDLDDTMLSKSFCMIDLTETDDDQTPVKKKPLATNTAIVNKQDSNSVKNNNVINSSSTSYHSNNSSYPSNSTSYPSNSTSNSTRHRNNSSSSNSSNQGSSRPYHQHRFGSNYGQSSPNRRERYQQPNRNKNYQPYVRRDNNYSSSYSNYRSNNQVSSYINSSSSRSRNYSTDYVNDDSSTYGRWTPVIQPTLNQYWTPTVQFSCSWNR